MSKVATRKLSGIWIKLIPSQCTLYLLLTDHGKRKADSRGDVDQPATKKIRVTIDVPVSCINSRTKTPSDIEVLTRIFPNQPRYLLEMVLQGCSGKVLQAIDVIRASSVANGTSGTTAQPQVNVTSCQQPPGVEAPPHLNYGGLMNNGYRYVYPRLMTLQPYIVPGSSGVDYCRYYYPNYTTSQAPIHLNSTTQNDQGPEENLPPRAHYKQVSNGLGMASSSSPKREETITLCSKCNFRQTNDKICERCGTNSELTENHEDI